MEPSLTKFALLCFTSLLSIINPLSAAPMYLGLDLRGGVHFMLQVDMQAALTKRAESLTGDLRSQLREANVRHGGIARNGQSIEIRLRDAATVAATRKVVVQGG